MVVGSYHLRGPIGLNLAYALALNQEETAANPSTIAHEHNGSVSQLSENIVHVFSPGQSKKGSFRVTSVSP